MMIRMMKRSMLMMLMMLMMLIMLIMLMVMEVTLQVQKTIKEFFYYVPWRSTHSVITFHSIHTHTGPQ